jgi:hypothetical protein
MGVEAARAALRGAPRRAPAAVYFATAAPAYLDKTNATAVHAALALDESAMAFDMLGTEASAAIFAGGVLKLLATWAYTRGKQGEARAAAQVEAGNDTMLAGSSVFAAAAVVSILVVLVVKLLDTVDLHPFYIATH